MFEIPQKILNILRKISANGYEAYIVGGCVRDLLMGIAPHDYDITTSATPDEIQAIFEKSIPTGIKHGTITVIEDGEPIEITTFRAESEYLDHRHPDKVEFVRDVESDLSRRDFTVNAMCYNEQKGLIDIFSGKKDIENRILRAVGDANERFLEDALRIMRLFRFASTLVFDIEPKTYTAAIENAHLIREVSVERINTELTKLLLGKKCEVITPLINCGALDFLEIKNCFNTNKLSDLPSNISIRLFAFLDNNTNLLEIAEKLKYSNKIKAEISTFERFRLLGVPKTKCDIKEMLNSGNLELLKLYFEYLHICKGIDADNLLKLTDEIIENKEAFSISHLAVSGSDLIPLGITGARLGETLEFLRGEVIKEPTLNNKAALIEKIKSSRN